MSLSYIFDELLHHAIISLKKSNLAVKYFLVFVLSNLMIKERNILF